MGRGIDFPGSNIVFHAPPGREDVVDLPVFTNGHVLVMCWELDEKEIAEIIRTKKVFMQVIGGTLPPHFIGSESTVRAMTADYGKIW